MCGQREGGLNLDAGPVIEQVGPLLTDLRRPSPRPGGLRLVVEKKMGPRDQRDLILWIVAGVPPFKEKTMPDRQQGHRRGTKRRPQKEEVVIKVEKVHSNNPPTAAQLAAGAEAMADLAARLLGKPELENSSWNRPD
jgi:hypothetical protein